MFSLSLIALAAMATELKKQNPITCWYSAWCPGGLTIAYPFLSSPAATEIDIAQLLVTSSTLETLSRGSSYNF